MNKKFFLSWLVMFVVWMMGSFLVHGVLLHEDYLKVQSLFRTETDSQQYMPVMLFAHVLLSGALVFVYRTGMQAKPWLGQGLRFGLVILWLNIAPLYLIYYAVQPLPALMVAKQILFDGSLMLLLGMLVAFLYRGQEK